MARARFRLLRQEVGRAEDRLIKRVFHLMSKSQKSNKRPDIPCSGRTSATIVTPLSTVSHPRPTLCHAIAARPTTRRRVQDIGDRGIATGSRDSCADYVQRLELLPFCLFEGFTFRATDLLSSLISPYWRDVPLAVQADCLGLRNTLDAARLLSSSPRQCPRRQHAKICRRSSR